jgi:hypothetical protein
MPISIAVLSKTVMGFGLNKPNPLSGNHPPSRFAITATRLLPAGLWGARPTYATTQWTGI